MYIGISFKFDIIGGLAFGWDTPLLFSADRAIFPAISWKKFALGAAGLIQGNLRPRQAARIPLEATRFNPIGSGELPAALGGPHSEEPGEKPKPLHGQIWGRSGRFLALICQELHRPRLILDDFQETFALALIILHQPLSVLSKVLSVGLKVGDPALFFGDQRF